MPKRFINPDWKKLRALPGYLQRAWFYIWDQADAAGVYHFDEDYIKLDLKLKEQVTIKDLAKLPECEILPGERILLKNFLVVNYTELKPNYNPHKPAFRAVAENGLTLNQSFNEASLRLEEEDKDKEEGKRERGAGKTEEVVDQETLVPTMLEKFKALNPEYPYDKFTDFPAMLEIAGKISKWQKQTGDPALKENRENILKRWGELTVHIKAHKFFSELSLTQLNKQFQSIVQSLNGNGKFTNGTSHKNYQNKPVIDGTATGAGDF